MLALYSGNKLYYTAIINKLELEKLDIIAKMQDLSTYSGNISDGVITPDEIMNSPASIFARQMGFSGYNCAKSWNQAGYLTQYYMQNMNMMNYNTQGHLQMLNDPTMSTSFPGNPIMIFQAFFKKALEAGAKSAKEQINREETILQQRKEEIETRLKFAQAQRDACEKKEDEGIKRLFGN